MNKDKWKKVPPRQIVMPKEEKNTTIICDLIWVEGIATWKPNPNGQYIYNLTNKTGKLL